MKKTKIGYVAVAVVILALSILAILLFTNPYRDKIISIHQITQNVISDPERREAFRTLIEAAEGRGKYGEVRSFALDDLGLVGAAHPELFYEEAIPVIIKGLNSEDGFVISGAAEAAGKFGSYAEPAIPTLLDAIEVHPSAVIPGVRSLGQIGRKPDVVLPILISMVPNRDSKTGQPTWARGYELEAIGAYGKEAQMAVPALEQALEDPETEYALKAARALAKVEPENKTLIKFLRETFERGNEVERYFVLVAVREMPLTTHSPSLESLIEAGLNDSDPDTRKLAKILKEGS